MPGIDLNQPKLLTLFEHFLYSFKFHIKDVGLSLGTGIFAMITFNDIPLIFTAIGTLVGTVLLPYYYGRRRYRKQEEREQEAAIIKAIRELRELGFILKTDSPDEQHRKAVDWLSKPIKE